MPFIQFSSQFKPTIGKPMSLERTHVDIPTLTLTLHYREWVDDGQQWNWEPRQQALTMHTHFRIDKRRGVIDLLDNLLWDQQGLWVAGDHIEPLLYKGQVKHSRGQYVEFSYEYYAPEDVNDPATVDLAEVDTVASARLGYDVLRYSPIAKESLTPAPWNWEKKT
jgi:hypothetical protein